MPQFRVIRIILLLLFVNSSVAHSDEMIKIKVATVAFIGDATQYFAYRQGYFADEGLDVELVQNSAGVESMKQVIRGEVDIGTVAPTPIVYLTLGRIDMPDDIRIVASVHQSSSLVSLVIMDQQEHPDFKSLVGKRIALQKQTSAEYFWYRVAIANNIPSTAVEIVDIPTRQIASRVTDDAFDAAVVWSPFHLDVLRNASDQAKLIGGNTIATEGWYVVTRPDFLAENPNVVKKYLRALKRAEQDILANPKQVAKYHAEIVDSSEQELLQLYDDISFRLNLSESDIFHLDQQANWAYQVGYVSQPPIDFRPYFDTTPLGEVSPESIRFLE